MSAPLRRWWAAGAYERSSTTQRRYMLPMTDPMLKFVIAPAFISIQIPSPCLVEMLITFSTGIPAHLRMFCEWSSVAPLRHTRYVQPCAMIDPPGRTQIGLRLLIRHTSWNWTGGPHRRQVPIMAVSRSGSTMCSRRTSLAWTTIRDESTGLAWGPSADSIRAR